MNASKVTNIQGPYLSASSFAFCNCSCPSFNACSTNKHVAFLMDVETEMNKCLELLLQIFHGSKKVRIRLGMMSQCFQERKVYGGLVILKLTICIKYQCEPATDFPSFSAKACSFRRSGMLHSRMHGVSKQTDLSDHLTSDWIITPRRNKNMPNICEKKLLQTLSCTNFFSNSAAPIPGSV